ncbi:MAG: uracil-DNA glycosylase [Bacteroidales bacterium]|jgi:uracil-DNA glycosylase|nr:uracil-DNA glycosylase [Bacteroidales bacterium]
METVKPIIEESWLEVLRSEFESDYFAQLKAFLVEERKQYRCFPPGKDIFSAFWHTPFHQVKVVILGQDPYHGDGQAHGLCFSVPQGIACPPSLVNIFKEINSDLGTNIPTTCGTLTGWADQGVFLLNTTLTVRAHQAGSHFGHGWEQFTDSVIRNLSTLRTGIVFLLWGNPAIAKAKLIDPSKHYILTAPHPSPLSAYRGFFGCKHFSRTNDILVKDGKTPIDWVRTL